MSRQINNKTMVDECSIDASLSLLGGTIFHFIVGIKTMWGNIAPYVTSYLVQFDPHVTYHKTLHVYTAVFLGQSLTMYLGGELEKLVGPRITAYIGTIMISDGTYMSSYCTTLRGLIYCQAMAGIGIGLSYSAPILCGFRHFKQNKGIVTGVITTGTGAGPFMAGLIATSFVNSENFPVDSITGLYDPLASPVVGRVPSMFRILGILYAVIGFVGASLLLDNTSNNEEPIEALVSAENGEKSALNKGSAIGVYDMAMLEEVPPTFAVDSKSYFVKGRGHQRYGSRVKFEVTFELTTPQMIRDSLCWLVIAASICIGVTGLYVSATFKSFGQTAIADDHFITVVGCFGCLCSGLSRTFWGSTADRIGHFETLELSAYISPAIMLVYTLSVGSKLAFGISVCALFWLWGASYCLMPAIVAFLFGDKHLGTNYGFVFLVYGVMCTVIINSAGNTGMEFGQLNYVFTFIALIGAGLCSHIRYLTSKVKDEKVLKHHRAQSSVSSMIL